MMLMYTLKCIMKYDTLFHLKDIVTKILKKKTENKEN